MKFSQLLLVATLSVASAAITATYIDREAHQRETFVATAAKETAFERVMKTRMLRCTYAIWAPYLMIDPNTKKLSGMDYEIMEAIGKAANLKIEWQDEIGYGQIPDQLQSAKQDVFCASIWLGAVRAQRIEMTNPLSYTPIYAFAREGDMRFDNNLSLINDEKVTVSVIDGSAPKAVADASFPKTKQLSLPQMASQAEILEAVATQKADVVFVDPRVILHKGT